MRLKETIQRSMRLPVHIWIREENATPEELAGYFTELARRLDAHPQKMRLMIESSVPAVLDFDPLDGEPLVSVCGRTQKFSLRHRWLPEHPVPLPLGSVPLSFNAIAGSVPTSAGSVPNATAGSVPASEGSVPNATAGSVSASEGSVPAFAGSVPVSVSGSVPNAKKRFLEFLGRFSAKKCVVLLIDPIEGNRFCVRSRRVLRVPRSLYALFAVVAVSAVVTLHPIAFVLSALLLVLLVVIAFQS